MVEVSVGSKATYHSLGAGTPVIYLEISVMRLFQTSGWIENSQKQPKFGILNQGQ